MMFLVLDYVYMKMKQDLERKVLVIDEAWSLLSRAEDASYIFEIVKTCRKFNLALFLINQEVEGMLQSEAGRSVLANSSYTILMRQKPSVIQAIQNTFNLSPSEKTFLLTAAIGEGLILMDDEHSEIRIVASAEEHKQITTKPDEIIKQNENNVITPNHCHKVNVDPDKRFFKYQDLSRDDLRYLLDKGYKEVKCLNISGKKERYLLKPRANESFEHCFLTFDVSEYLKSKTDKLELFTSVRPDIVFELNGKKYAVEIETGKVLASDRNKFLRKVNSLKSEFGKNWFFVVTNRNLSPTYNNFGKTFTRKIFIKQFDKWQMRPFKVRKA
jgi:hypothetical protein